MRCDVVCCYKGQRGKWDPTLPGFNMESESVWRARLQGRQGEHVLKTRFPKKKALSTTLKVELSLHCTCGPSGKQRASVLLTVAAGAHPGTWGWPPEDRSSSTERCPALVNRVYQRRRTSEDVSAPWITQLRAWWDWNADIIYCPIEMVRASLVARWWRIHPAAAQYQKNKQPNKILAEDLNKHFSKEDTQMINKYEKMLNIAYY